MCLGCALCFGVELCKEGKLCRDIVSSTAKGLGRRSENLILGSISSELGLLRKDRWKVGMFSLLLAGSTPASVVSGGVSVAGTKGEA